MYEFARQTRPTDTSNTQHRRRPKEGTSEHILCPALTIIYKFYVSNCVWALSALCTTHATCFVVFARVADKWRIGWAAYCLTHAPVAQRLCSRHRCSKAQLGLLVYGSRFSKVRVRHYAANLFGFSGLSLEDRSQSLCSPPFTHKRST